MGDGRIGAKGLFIIVRTGREEGRVELGANRMRRGAGVGDLVGWLSCRRRKLTASNQKKAVVRVWYLCLELWTFRCMEVACTYCSAAKRRPVVRRWSNKALTAPLFRTDRASSTHKANPPPPPPSLPTHLPSPPLPTPHAHLPHTPPTPNTAHSAKTPQHPPSPPPPQPSASAADNPSTPSRHAA